MKYSQKHILLTALMIGFWQYSMAQLCNLPILSGFNNTTQTEFTATWIDFNSNVESFEIEFGIKGFTRTFEANVFDIQTNNFTFSDLNPGTTYEIYIKTVCGTDNKSDWNGPYFNNTVINNQDNCGLNLNITDDNCPRVNTFQIEVKGFENKILGSDINLENVALSISHTWPPDLLIQLTSPNGKSAVLSDHNGNGIDNYGSIENGCLSNANFNDKACIKISDWPPPFIGSFKAEDELSLVFNGEPANGIWELTICDRAAGDVGYLSHLNLTFSEETCQPPQEFILFDIEGTNATFNWQSFDNCNIIKLTYKEVGAPPEDVFIDFIDCDSENFIATGLTPSTTYELTVTTQCQSGLSSEPLCELMFTTRCRNNDFYESFDQEELCIANCDSICLLNGLWKNMSGLSNNWSVMSGPSNSEFTGPKGDKNISGNYIHIESSLSCTNNQSAILSTECLSFQNNSDCSISFYYHMFGNEVGTLFLESSIDEQNWKTIWEKQGNQGDQWLFETLNFNETLEIGKIRFRAESLPNSTRGDIALDHIKLYNAESRSLVEYYLDFDDDGFGTQDSIVLICSDIDISGYSKNSLDCDDQNTFINPNASEIPCNLVDENCNGQTDDAISTDLLIEVISVKDETCKGIADGSIHIVASQGNPPYSYKWNSGDSGSILENALSGVYMCTVTGVDGCQSTSSPIVIGFEDILVYNIANIDNTTCQGASDGNITINVAGGIAPYDILWSSGDDGISTDDLEAGFYHATINSTNGCQLVTDEIEVLGNQILTTGVALKNDIDCFGDSTGFIQLGIIGGTPPYHLNWSHGDTSSFTSNIPAGHYNVTIVDQLGCFNIMDSILISEPEQLAVSLNNKENVTCHGDQNGFIDININGGSPPYSYFWSNGDFSQDLINVPSDIYSVTITDFKACSAVLSNIDIIQPTAFIIELDSISSVPCSGSKEGYVGINVSGGTMPYNYNWSNFDGINSFDSSIDELLPGQYFVTVVDAFGCKSLPGKFEVNSQNVPINISIISHSDLMCFNDSTASVIAVSQTSNLPIDFNWSAGQKAIKNILSDTIFQLSSGQYNVTITDNEGCVGVSDFITITNPSEIEYEVINLTNNLCESDNDGSIEINANGGTGDLQYQWNSGQMNRNITNLANGLYQLSISDDNDCETTTDTFTIKNLITISINAQITNANPTKGGEIILNATGGTPPYKYNWEAPFTAIKDSILINLDPGEYAVTIEDSNGCIKDTALLVDFMSNSSNLLPEDKFVIYPNPVNDILKINFKDTFAKGFINIYNANGIMVKNLEMENKSDYQLDFSELSNGVYFIETIIAELRYISKIIVVH